MLLEVLVPVATVTLFLGSFETDAGVGPGSLRRFGDGEPSTADLYAGERALLLALMLLVEEAAPLDLDGVADVDAMPSKILRPLRWCCSITQFP